MYVYICTYIGCLKFTPVHVYLGCLIFMSVHMYYVGSNMCEFNTCDEEAPHPTTTENH
jgi:hypothetical protein